MSKKSVTRLSIIITRTETDMGFSTIHGLDDTFSISTGILKIICRLRTNDHSGPLLSPISGTIYKEYYLHWVASISLFAPLAREAFFTLAMVIWGVFHCAYFFLESFTTGQFSFITDRISNAYSTIEACSIIIT